MHVLAINSATKKTAIALLEIPEAVRSAAGTVAPKAHVLFEKSWKSNRDEAEKLLPQVAAILKKGNVQKIFVVDGPGSFTGLRVGVTIANTLAYVFKIKLVSCSTFDYFRMSIPEETVKHTATILAAGGDYIAVLMPGAKKPSRLQKKDLSKFLQKKKTVKYVTGDLIPEDKKSLMLPKGVSWIPEVKLKKLSAVTGFFLSTKPSMHALIKPRYLLPPKITQSKKKLFT